MSLGSDIFGYIAGAAGLIGILYAIIQSQRPRNKFKYLNELLNDTEELFSDAKRNGLLNPHFVHNTDRQLANYKQLTEELRTRALCANTILAECVEVARGLSKLITVTCSEVDECRAAILTASQQERERLRRQIQNQDSQCRFGDVLRNASSPPCSFVTPGEPDSLPISSLPPFRTSIITWIASVVGNIRASFAHTRSSATNSPADLQELSEIPSGDNSTPNQADVSIRHSEQMA